MTCPTKKVEQKRDSSIEKMRKTIDLNRDRFFKSSNKT